MQGQLVYELPTDRRQQPACASRVAKRHGDLLLCLKLGAVHHHLAEYPQCVFAVFRQAFWDGDRWQLHLSTHDPLRRDLQHRHTHIHRAAACRSIMPELWQKVAAEQGCDCGMSQGSSAKHRKHTLLYFSA